VILKKTVEILRIMIGEMAIMEKIWFAEYQKTGIPETVELPAENTSLVDVFERNFQNSAPGMPLSLLIRQ